MLERLREIQLNFYNRLESKKLIKKQGKVPFTEHMTISKTPFQSVLFTPDMLKAKRSLFVHLGNSEAVSIPDALEVHNDIKREVAL